MRTRTTQVIRMAELVVVLGGTRSGKSEVAENIVARHDQVVYVATATATDDEMQERIRTHRLRRPSHWQTAEAEDLAAAVASASAGAAILIDGLGPWLARRMDTLGAFDEGASADGVVAADVTRLIAAVAAHPGPAVVVVAEEAGMGVVAGDRGTRAWVDILGASVQQLSAAAERVLLVHAGRVVDLPPAAASPAAARSVDLRAHGDTMVEAGAVDFAVNIHGEGPPPHLNAALARASSGAGRYPDPARAVAAISRRHARPPEEVLATAGAAEVFWLLASAVRVRRAAVVHPQFTEPEAALRASGISVDHVLRSPDDNWTLHPDDVPADADLVVVGSPNNPTGTLDDPAAIAALCRPGRITVVDEAFGDFVADRDAGVAARRDLPGLVVVRSVTKLWGLAGVRAGYMLAPPGLVRRCSGLRQPWAVNAAALAALEICAADEEYRRSVSEVVSRWRADVLRELRALPGVTAWDSAANFVLIRVPEGRRVHAALSAAGIAVRPSTFPGLDDDYLRIAVRPPETTAHLLEALRDILLQAPA